MWVGKFETSGGSSVNSKITSIKPNMSGGGYSVGSIGDLFSISINMSQNPDGAAGGMESDYSSSSGSIYPIAKLGGANGQNLSSEVQSRLARRSDYGAVAYLTTSEYGRWGSVGGNAVYNTRGSTGCTTGDVSGYGSCKYYYDSDDGAHGSTTDNIYGIYDMSGGPKNEVVMSNVGATAGDGMSSVPQTKYMDIYYVGPFGIKPATSISTNQVFYNFDVCDFSLCGGQALYETTTVQSVNSDNNIVWFDIAGGGFTNFPSTSDRWIQMVRGSYESLFSIYSYDGGSDSLSSSVISGRAILSRF
jgi:hypothetical protein